MISSNGMEWCSMADIFENVQAEMENISKVLLELENEFKIEIENYLQNLKNSS